MERQEYKRFWQQLLAQASAQTDLHAGVAPGTQATSTAVVAAGVAFAYELHDRERSARLVFNHPERAVNKTLYDALARQREAIDTAFSEPLRWSHEAQEPGYKSASIGRFWENGDDVIQGEQWPSYQHELIEAMVKLEAALRPHLTRQLGAKYRPKRRR